MARIKFEVDEWYHCYSRGVDKRVTFEDEADHIRFIELLYLANDTSPLHRKDIGTHSAEEIFSRKRVKPLVAVGAYALMPNHYHLLLKEVEEGGLSEFMRKLGIAYTTYFNHKYERVGNLFVKPFRARHVAEDTYFQHIVNYIHLNPAELFESGWKKGRVKNPGVLIKKLESYPYSSFPDHQNIPRFMNRVINPEIFEAVDKLTAAAVVREAASYYESSAELEQ
jgi:putative transposase